jgi:hypothetical protein
MMISNARMTPFPPSALIRRATSDDSTANPFLVSLSLHNLLAIGQAGMQIILHLEMYSNVRKTLA